MPSSGDLFQEEGKDIEIRNISVDVAMKLIANLRNNESEIPINIRKLTMKADRRARTVLSQLQFTISTIKGGA